MARPKKNNADYFSHDADMRNDVRIKAIRRKFKLSGYAIWCMLLEVLTDSNYFQIEWNDMEIELLSADFDIEPADLKAIVEYCVSLGLFQIQDGKLFSESHRKRFNALLSKRNRDNNRVFDSGNPAETQQISVSDNESAQSKVKYSKVNNISLSNESDVKREKEIFLEILFFEKGVLHPQKELSNFLNHYTARGWVDKNGTPLPDSVDARSALLRSWSVKNFESNSFFAEWWREVYAAFEKTLNREKLLTDISGLKVEEAYVHLKLSKELAQILEENIPLWKKPFCQKFPNKQVKYFTR